MEKYTRQQMDAMLNSLANAIKGKFAGRDPIPHHEADELVEECLDQHLISLDEDMADIDTTDPIEEELFICRAEEDSDDSN